MGRTRHLFGTFTFAGALLLALLVSCGGGGDTAPPAAVPEPVVEATPEITERVLGVPFEVETPAGFWEGSEGQLEPVEEPVEEPDTAVTPRAEMSEALASMLGDISQRDRAQSNRYKGKAAAIEEGKKDYEAVCMSCHGATGKGDGPAAAHFDGSVSNLVDADRAAKITDGERFIVVKKGVPGTHMQSFGVARSDKQLWKVLAYVDSLR